MNITNEIVARAVKLARTYDKSPVCERPAVAPEFDSLTDGLSDAQCAQLAKIVARKI